MTRYLLGSLALTRSIAALGKIIPLTFSWCVVSWVLFRLFRRRIENVDVQGLNQIQLQRAQHCAVSSDNVLYSSKSCTIFGGNLHVYIGWRRYYMAGQYSYNINSSLTAAFEGVWQTYWRDFKRWTNSKFGTTAWSLVDQNCTLTCHSGV